jgi:cold shock protein
MIKGKVKWYDDVKGFGFIETEEHGDVFVHRSGLEVQFGGLENDQMVEFDVKQGPKGLVAVDVKSVG